MVEKRAKKFGHGQTPPPYIRAMPERKRFFSIDVFPKLLSVIKLCTLDDRLDSAMMPSTASTARGVLSPRCIVYIWQPGGGTWRHLSCYIGQSCMDGYWTWTSFDNIESQIDTDRPRPG